MDVAKLAVWRDAALIVLAVEAIALGLLPVAALYWSLRALGQLIERLLPILFESRMILWRVQQGTQRVMGAIAVPFVWLHSTAEGLRRTLEYLGWR